MKSHLEAHFLTNAILLTEDMNLIIFYLFYDINLAPKYRNGVNKSHKQLNFLLSKFWQKLREKTLRATVLLNVFTVFITYLELYVS